MSRRGRLQAACAAMLASVANAGLFAATANDLKPFVPFGLGPAWLVPGVIMVGACVALAVRDAARAAVAVVAAAVAGSTIFGLVLAAPGYPAETLRVTLVDRGTTFGLVALLVSGLFGMAGLGIVWIVRSLFGGADL